MDGVCEIAVSNRTVITQDGRATTEERQYSGTIDAQGVFHLRQYSGKRFVEPSAASFAGGVLPQNDKKAASAA